jgi:hypothetical protein
MATNLPKVGFSLFIEQGALRLNLCDGLDDLEEATNAARAFAAVRFVDLGGIVIRCDATGQQWIAADLIEAMDRPTVPTPVPKNLN